MKKELGYFLVEGSYGWDQDKFAHPMMKRGGCATVTAAELCICLKKYHGFDRVWHYGTENLSREEYIEGAEKLYKHLYPRMHGVDSLEMYMDNLNAWFEENGETSISLSGFPGESSIEGVEEVIISQIDRGFPIPCLLLRHNDPDLEDYTWHWFIINGYSKEEKFAVKTVSYGTWRWMGLEKLWNTGHRRRGGLIIVSATRNK